MVTIYLGSSWLVSTHFVQNRLKATEHRVDVLTRYLLEDLILPSRSLKEMSLDLVGPFMKVHQPSLDLPCK